MEDNVKLFKDLPAFEENPAVGEAIESFQKSIEKEPENPMHHYQLGRAYLAKGKKLAALEEYQAALKINRNFAPAHSGIGMIYASVGKVNLAIKEYSKALRCNSASLDTLYNLALCYEQSRIFSKAVRFWQSYVEKEKDPVWIEDAKTHLRTCETKSGKS